MARLTYLIAVLAAPTAFLPAPQALLGGEDIRPLSAGDLAQARDQLAAAVARLDERLQADGPNGAAWAQAVSFPKLKSEMAAAQPTRAVLEQVRERFEAGDVGLNLVVFADVREALEKYLGTASALADPKAFAADYAGARKSLDQHLEAYLKTGSPLEAEEVNRELRWLDMFGQATDRVRGILAQHHKPNFFMQVSADTVAAAFANRIDETGPLTDCILGTSIHGTSHTQADVTGQLFPYEQGGVIDAVLVGQANTNNVGYNGPAQIFSVATTPFQAKKRIWVTPQGVFGMCSIAEAQVCSTVTGLCVNGGRLVQRIASKRVAQQKPEADAIAAQHAQQRVQSRLDQQADEMVARNNEQFQVKFRDPLLERGLFPAVFKITSSADAVHLVAVAAKATEMAASREPPPPIEGADLAVRLQESVVNNSAMTAVAGMTIHEKELQDGVFNWLGSLPDELKSNPDGVPWELTFTEQQPISLTVAQDRFEIVVRSRRIVRGENRYRGMYVKANYRIVQDQGRPKAVREDPLDINPPVSKTGKTPAFREYDPTLKSLLRRRFDRIFTEELFDKPIQPKGEMAKVGKFETSYLRAEPGWLSIGWRRVDAPPPPAVPPAKQVTAD